MGKEIIKFLLSHKLSGNHLILCHDTVTTVGNAASTASVGHMNIIATDTNISTTIKLKIITHSIC